MIYCRHLQQKGFPLTKSRTTCLLSKAAKKADSEGWYLLKTQFCFSLFRLSLATFWDLQLYSQQCPKAMNFESSLHAIIYIVCGIKAHNPERATWATQLACQSRFETVLGHCVVFFGKILYSNLQCLSPPQKPDRILMDDNLLCTKILQRGE